MIPKLSKVTIYVEDQQQAKHFWVDRMGYRVAYEQAAGPEIGRASCRERVCQCV